MVLMIGSRNGATSPSSKSKSVWVTVSRLSRRARDLWPTYINAQQHKNILTIQGKPLHLAQTRSLAFDSFWKMDHRVWQIKPPRIDTKCTHPPPRGGGNWLWRLTILHEWLEMSKQRGKRHAAYFSILLIPLLCVPPPSASDAFYLLWARTMLLVAGFFPVRQRRNYEMFQCATGFFFHIGFSYAAHK